MSSENTALCKDITSLCDGPKESINEKTDENSKIFDEKSSDAFGFLILGFLYFVQGMPLGFFERALTFIFTERGASFTDLSKISLIIYPYGFKFIFAPLQDSYYFSKFGKRKTYIVPSLLIVGAIIFVTAFFVEKYIENMEINVLVGIGLVIVTLMALQDIAVDGWVVSLISKKNLSFVGAFQQILLRIGSFTGFNLLIPLNSTEFCNKYLFSEPHNRPLITLQEFFIASGLLTIIVGLSMIFFKEKAMRKEHIITFKEVVFLKNETFKFKKFVTNQNLRIFSFLLLFSFVSYASVNGIFEPILIKEGYKKEDMTNIRTVILPFQFLAVWAGAYLSKKTKKDLSLFTYSMGILGLTNILAYWILNNSTSLTFHKLTVFIILQEGCWCIYWFADGCFTSYVLGITHESTASTFITSIYSLWNISTKWPESLALAVKEYVPLNAIIFFAIGFGILFTFIQTPYYMHLQSKSSLESSISYGILTVFQTMK